jgi:soluble lytic murein transglycosylase-like protein
MRPCLGLVTGLALAAAAMAAGAEDFPARATSVVRSDRRTGRLVRAVVAPPAPSRAASGKLVPDLVKRTAEVHQLDPLLVHSVIEAESDYNPYALSPKGAQGLMQLMPSTARRFGVADSFNIAENIEGGVRYLKYLMGLFGDEKLAVAAYNAGEQAVMRYHGVPPYPETQNYVRAVSASYASAKSAAAAQTAPKEEAKEESEPVYRPIEQFTDEQGVLHVQTR